VISGFHHEVAENCTRLGYYGAGSGNFLLTFWTTYQSHLIQGSRFLNPEDGTDRLSPTSVRNYHYSPHNNPEECGSQL